MPIAIPFPWERYTKEKENFKKLILDYVLFDNITDYYYGIKNLIKKSNIGLIEYIVQCYNYVNKQNKNYTPIEPELFLNSMKRDETSAFAKKIREILCEQFVAYWKDCVTDLVSYLKFEADNYIIREAYDYLPLRKMELIVHIHNEYYNPKIVAEYGAIQREIDILQLIELPETEQSELGNLISDAVIERYKKL